MKKGFTLIELLVVVLIIGVLSAIAIPMYQGAVDKSHWSTMLPGAKAIKDAEEAFKMSNDGYTSEMANLDVTMENNDLTFSLITPNNTSDPNVIRVTNSKLANVRLASYLDDNPKFAGQLHCEALTGDERANRLCGGLLQGQELTSADGYTGYLLDQSIDKATCDNANRSWSTSKTKCYKTDQERCQALGVSLISEGQCGYKDTQNQIIGEEMLCNGEGWAGCNGATVNEGGVCQGNNQNSCRNTIINNGGTCLGSWDHGACAYATVNNGGMCIAETWDGCLHATVNAGGTCWAKGGSTIYPSYMFMCSGSTLNGGTCKADQGYTCRGVTINAGGVCEANVANTCAGSYGSAELTVNDGGVCKANAPNTCVGTYNGTGCCEGTYCPSDAPKCS